MTSRCSTRLHKLCSIYRPRLAWYSLLAPIAWLAPPSLGVPAGIVLGLKVIYWIYTFPRFESGATFSLRCVGLSPRAIARLHGAGRQAQVPAQRAHERLRADGDAQRQRQVPEHASTIDRPNGFGFVRKHVAA